MPCKSFQTKGLEPHFFCPNIVNLPVRILPKSEKEEIINMSWNDVDLTKVSATIEPVALGEYVFVLDPGARLESDGRISVSATIAEGSFAGRRMFFSYPDPSRFDWAPRVFKRLVNALGVEADEGEKPLEVLSRSAGLRFAAPVKAGKTTEEYPTPKHELDIFKTHAA
jgi:hypothetical protein